MLVYKNHMSSSDNLDTMTQLLPDYTGLSIGAPIPSPRGCIKQSFLTLEGKPFQLIAGSTENPLYVPFEVEAFSASDTSTRLNLNLAITDPELDEYFTELDKAILDIVTNDSVKFFNKSLSAEHISALYKRILPDNTNFDKLLRTKINLQPPQQVKVWNEDRTQIELPQQWKGTRLVVAIKVKSLYFSSNSWGTILDAQHVMISNQEEDLCPF